MQFQRGMVVGKFAPLHRGHEALLHYAEACCEELVVISYSKPEMPGCSPRLRERWLRALLPAAIVLVVDDEELARLCTVRKIPARQIPHNDATDDEQRLFVVWLCQEILNCTVDAVFTSEHYGDGFAQVLTECFREREVTAPVVRHVGFDLARSNIPISGTALRADPRLRRGMLSLTVHRDLVERIAVLGGESSGKTTISRALAAKLNTAWVSEYGRELWVEQHGQLTYGDLYKIAVTQIAREQQACGDVDRWLVCDTSPLTTLLYCRHMFARAEPHLEELAQRNIAYALLEGSVDTRVQTAIRAVSSGQY